MSDSEAVLLSTAYLPNIQYFTKVLFYRPVYIETHEHYQKQSYRNRTTILSANGPLDLIIPIIKTNGNHTLINEVVIDNSYSWQKVHWKAIVSSYKKSPFFEIFEHELEPFFKRKEKYLLDWNSLLLDLLFSLTGINRSFVFTEKFEDLLPASILDFRNKIHPKRRMRQPDERFWPVKYSQVFSPKYRFIGNLSFIDLLFNEGPQAISICNKSIKEKGNTSMLPPYFIKPGTND